ncbi:histidine phosphatase family protein [Variovorax sp. JS1663]|uniref:histidine phosphatase family protein n=1 Tax=Variovorax sp. JS1663 TaxID=1851577 RepID=UPI00192D190B|nr:histidine phosphatase family protein [Variovorax sp. JS1663]
MHGRRDLILLAAALLLQRAHAQQGGDAMAGRLRAGGCALLWRHAQTTPGVGDPPGFSLAQCSTQRNLSDAGRAQARAAGEWFRSRGLAPRAVRSSAWCRCKDTADLAFGAHESWTPLNSSFGNAAVAPENRSLLLAGLARIPAGTFEVWVTHQVNITAFTGEAVAMGEAVVVDRDGQVVARGGFGA